MADETGCTICCESREDLRMLPCWHVACLACILTMAQVGEGRAMKCHQCRRPFLFENVRSLPQPLKCSSCRRFLQNPRQFKCCSLLMCFDCFEKFTGDERETVTCPKQCTKSQHQLVEIVTPRICCQCFALHTNAMESCDHSVCSTCNSELSAGHRVCPLCSAVGSPMPIPIYPAGQNDRPSGLNNVLNDLGQPISQMHLISAIQTVRIWNQRNARQRQQPAQQATNYAPGQFKQDFPKACAAMIAMGIVAYGWGITCWIWIVMALYFLMLRPNQMFMTMLGLLIAFVYILCLLYQHFLATICYGLMWLSFIFGYQCLLAHYRRPDVAGMAVWAMLFLKPIVTWGLFPPIFTNLAVFEFFMFTSIVLVTVMNNGVPSQPRR